MVTELQGCAFARNIPSHLILSPLLGSDQSISQSIHPSIHPPFQSGQTEKPLQPSTGQMTDVLPSQQLRGPTMTLFIQPLVFDLQPPGQSEISSTLSGRACSAVFAPMDSPWRSNLFSMPVPKVAINHDVHALSCLQPGPRVLGHAVRSSDMTPFLCFFSWTR